MKSLWIICLIVAASLTTVFAQDHGSITFNGKKINLTGYRTRLNNNKRVIIADGKADNELYSLTVTLKADVSTETTLKADATHSITLTVSNADYSNARNFCFDGGSSFLVSPGNGKFVVSGENLTPGNCFGKAAASGNKLSISIKP